MLHNNISSTGFIKYILLAEPSLTATSPQAAYIAVLITAASNYFFITKRRQVLDKPNNGHRQGQPLALPVPPASAPCTCLQESSAGGAQEHHGVVIDAGDRHRGEAVVGEHGGGGDGVHNGQRVLQVRCSAVQLLRLQLWGHTCALAAAPGQVLPSASTAQTSEPKEKASLPSHSTGKCRSIWGQEQRWSLPRACEACPQSQSQT